MLCVVMMQMQQTGWREEGEEVYLRAQVAKSLIRISPIKQVNWRRRSGELWSFDRNGDESQWSVSPFSGWSLKSLTLEMFAIIAKCCLIPSSHPIRQWLQFPLEELNVSKEVNNWVFGVAEEGKDVFNRFFKSYEFIKSSLEGSQSVITSSSLWSSIFTVYEAGEVN